MSPKFFLRGLIHTSGNGIPAERGFTLVELIFTIVISGIMVAVAAMFIVRPMQGYVDLGRRAMLVDGAENALRMMARDIRNALPNSVRLINNPGGSAGFALELVPIIDGAMYRRGGGDGAGPLNQLDADKLDDQFDVHKFFQHITVPSSSTTHRVVVNNKGSINFDVYGPYPTDGKGVIITPAGTSISYDATGVGGAHHVTLSALHKFRGDSPYRRIYIIEMPVSYRCLPNAANPQLGTLTRYSNYAISTSQPVTDADFNASATVRTALVADHVGACSVTTTTADVRNRSLVTLTLELSEQGEQIRLIHQVQLDNSR